MFMFYVFVLFEKLTKYLNHCEISYVTKLK